MYEPFEQAIDRYEEHPEHKVSLAVYEARLAECDGCQARNELTCNANPKCRACSLIRAAERPQGVCHWGRWDG